MAFTRNIDQSNLIRRNKGKGEVHMKAIQYLLMSTAELSSHSGWASVRPLEQFIWSDEVESKVSARLSPPSFSSTHYYNKNNLTNHLPRSQAVLSSADLEGKKNKQADTSSPLLPFLIQFFPATTKSTSGAPEKNFTHFKMCTKALSGRLEQMVLKQDSNTPYQTCKLIFCGVNFSLSSPTPDRIAGLQTIK